MRSVEGLEEYLRPIFYSFKKERLARFFEESTHWYHGQKPDHGKFEHVQHPIWYYV